MRCKHLLYMKHFPFSRLPYRTRQQGTRQQIVQPGPPVQLEQEVVHGGVRVGRDEHRRTACQQNSHCERNGPSFSWGIEDGWNGGGEGLRT